jgi:hypothetical protein
MEGTDVLSKHRDFLSRVKAIHLERLESRKRTTSQFNVFSVLGLTRSELNHSTFLRFLLDPNGKHTQGDIFLRTFLDRVVQLNWRGNLSDTWVTQERVIDDLGRVDIAIHLTDGRIVLIENKVDAEEGLKQIDRYLQWLAKQKPPRTGKHVLIFLTPHRKDPISTMTPEKVVPVSYCDIAHWLSKVSATLPDRLKLVLGQYIECCQTLGGIRMVDDNLDLKSFLREPENIEIGFDMEEALADIRKEVYQEFWKRVKGNLDASLRSRDADSSWEACAEELRLLGIVWKNEKRSREFFSVSFEKLDGVTKYGVRRGKPLKGTDNRDLSLMVALKDKFDPHDLWAGWRCLHNEDQAFLPNRTKENTIALLRDNLSPSHPLAEKVTDIVWELFIRHRLALEDLNRSYPY